IHGRRPDIDARLDLFAEVLVRRTRDTALDEIVVVGHSLGAMLVLDVIGRALARDAEFGRCAPAVCVLTLAARIPKFALRTRTPYDYFLMVCGPAPFADWTTSPLGLLNFVEADGTFRDPSPRSVVAQRSL